MSVDDVENLSTLVVDKLRGINLALKDSALLRSLSVSMKEVKIMLSTFTVDNLVEKCAEVIRTQHEGLNRQRMVREAHPHAR